MLKTGYELNALLRSFSEVVLGRSIFATKKNWRERKVSADRGTQIQSAIQYAHVGRDYS